MDGTDGRDGSKPAQYFPGISLRVGPTELEFRFGGSLKFKDREQDQFGGW
jgi:hypothetical protein